MGVYSVSVRSPLLFGHAEISERFLLEDFIGQIVRLQTG